MNELELLRAHLDAEMRHFDAVRRACTEILQRPGGDRQEFLRACLDYLAFATERLQGSPDPELTAALRSVQAANGTSSASDWQRFAASLERQLHTRQDAIKALRERGGKIAEWRALARLDADGIVRERDRYQCLRRARPTDLTTELP